MAKPIRQMSIHRTISLSLCAALLSAQQPAPAPNPPPDPVFSVTATLVQVDAVVTDSKHHHITGLTADDFAVYEDGKTQKITRFSYVRVTPHALAGPKVRPKAAAHSPLAPPTPAAPLGPGDVRRTIVLMVDDLGLSFESMAWVRTSLRKFVERQMQPGDLIAICRTGAGSGAQRQFTNDKRILLAAIDGLRWNPNGRAGLSFFEAYGKISNLAQDIAGHRPPGLGAASGGGLAGKGPNGPVTNIAPNGGPDSLNATYNAQRNTNFTVGTLGAIQYIVDALRDMPGRKSIVLFSDGLQLFTPAQGPVMHQSMVDVQDTENNAGIQDALHKLLDRANRAGTVIYTMHTAGLQPIVLGADDRFAPTGMSMDQRQHLLDQMANTRDATLVSGQQGLAYLAQETGGIFYQNGNDLNWGLDRVLEDQEGYYLIGFKPSSGTFEHGERNYHHVSVKVTRPGLHVRSRSGFFGETDEETLPKYRTPLDEMRAAMLSPFRSSDVRLRLTALYAATPKGRTVVRNLLHIDARDLTFQTRLDATTHTSESSAKIEVVAVATGIGDVPAASVAQSYTVPVKGYKMEESLAEGVLYSLDVPVKKSGPYQIQIAVRDEATGKMGSASQFLEIPDLKRGRLALTSILLQQGDRPDGAPASTGATPATRQFRAGDQVEYFCLIVTGGKKPLDHDIDAEIRVLREGKEVFRGPANLLPMENGKLAVSGRLKLSSDMPAGDYYLGVFVAERNSPRSGTAAQWTDFEILPDTDKRLPEQ